MRSVVPDLYLNSYFVGSLVVFCLCMYFSFFLIRLRNKSPATAHLALTMVFLAAFNAAYMLRYAFLTENAAYLRWSTTAVILPVILHFTQFVLRFPSNRYPRFSTVVLYTQWAIHLAIAVYFVSASAKTQKILNFQGHYFDFDADDATSVQSVTLLAYIIFSGLAAMWRVVREKSSFRWAILGQASVLLFILTVPATLNILSRDGTVSHAYYQNSYSFFMLLGLFVVVTLFLNSTPDTTSFMSRVVGISLATFLVVVQIISHLMLSFADAAFDESRKDSAALAAVGLQAQHQPDWVREYEISKGKWQNQVSIPDASASHTESLLMAWREGLHLDRVKSALNSSQDIEWLGALETDLTRYRAKNPGEPFALLEKDLNVLRNRIARIDSSDFFTAAGKKIMAAPVTLAEVKRILLQRLHSLKLSRDFRAAFVTGIVIPQSAKGRRFSNSDVAGSRIVYSWLDSRTGKIIEAGFSYVSYRLYIHNLVAVLSVITVAGFLLFILPFPAFFTIALVRPLRNLLDAVAQVQAGELDKRVKVTASDEFGVLGRAFNAMTISIKEGRDALSRHASILEDKVKERTQNLEESLTKVQQLKTQQDGDYFLTSLLLNPLGTNRVVSREYHVEFFVKQKKQFDFKAWKAEIGGDLCVADQISLKGEGYIVLLNSDAMGKSIQGAGGAVVLGSVFHAIVDRSRASAAEMNRFPETWLRDAFSELQKVFIVFDGSMLVSMFLALVHEKTGAMYFLNAEHPWPVLIRAGKAEFLKHQVFFRKLGVVPGNEKYPWRKLREDSPLRIETAQLQAGDVLLIGSDGRDDVLLGQNPENRERKINEDENIFRALAEKKRGSLKDMYEELRNIGELVDDLSLIKLNVGISPSKRDAETEQLKSLVSTAYKNQKFAEALVLSESMAQGAERSALEALIHHRIEDYATSIEKALFALEVSPLKHDMLYILARSYRKTKQYQAAIDWSERYRLRRPTYAPNLSLLSNLYLTVGQKKQAEFYARAALHFDKTQAAASKILSLTIEEEGHDQNLVAAI